jgi:hypothetical protein
MNNESCVLFVDIRILQFFTSPPDASNESVVIKHYYHHAFKLPSDLARLAENEKGIR